MAILINGELAVHVFWVLSGFVLSLPLLTNVSPSKVSLAAAKRYFRLVPLAFVSTLVSYIVHVTGGYGIIEEYSRHTGATTLNIALSALQIRPYPMIDHHTK